MKYSQIPTIEQEAIFRLASAPGVPSHLARQIHDSTQVERSFSLAGGFVDFPPDPQVEPIAGLPDFHVADLSATNGLGQSVEFILFIRNGLLSSLEIYTNGNVLPGYEGMTFDSSSMVKLDDTLGA